METTETPQQPISYAATADPATPTLQLTRRPSMAGRAFLAVSLLIGFYLFALTLAGALLYVIYAEWVYAGAINLRITIFCLLGAGIILWSIIPRPNKFVAPGPRLSAHKQPQLFENIKDVSKLTRQAMPAEVYLIPEVNAWVGQRGGFLGFGSYRVMGIGLPLLQILTVSQLRAVLAHEFGHYYGGDTRLGPWVYRTYTAILRSLHNLSMHSSILQMPFVWYGKMFLRVTHAISRRQEFVADELAARTMGARALAGGLRAVHGGALAFDAYWKDEVVPVLSSGYRPPLADGFQRFISSALVSSAVSMSLHEELNDIKPDPYRTHPPLAERLAALEQLPPGVQTGSDPLAIVLLSDIPTLEKDLLRIGLTNGEKIAAFKTVDWERTATDTFLPRWQAIVSSNQALFNGVTFADLPAAVTHTSKYGQLPSPPSGTPYYPDEMKERTIELLGTAMLVALHSHGWDLSARPGEPVTASHAGIDLQPFQIMQGLATGKISAESWQQQCEEASIAGLNLR